MSSSSSQQRPVYIPPSRRNVRTTTSTTTATASSGSGNGSHARSKLTQPQRFHGAFTGGFSAGHFNTVGSQEGWTPSTQKVKVQRPEDFMDEDDRAEWGGPTSVRADYHENNELSTQQPKSQVQSQQEQQQQQQQRQQQNPLDLGLESMLTVTHNNVGPRLLRVLGWREESGTAIVPDTAKNGPSTEKNGQNGKNCIDGDAGDDDDDVLARIHLSQKRLRKIRVQSSRVQQLPPPKLDQCGLGFDPHKDAPEFQKYRQQRQQLAQDRAVYSNEQKTYRLSDLTRGQPASIDDTRDGAKAKAGTVSASMGGYLSFETTEDFVGARSVGGFALRDDEDDAYDNAHTDDGRNHPLLGVGRNEDEAATALHHRLSENEYNTEVYEHVDSEGSDGDDNNQHSSSLPSCKTSNASLSSKPANVGNLFASWASGSAHGAQSTHAAEKVVPASPLTSSGKPPLSGFILGSSVTTNQKRFPGPKIPRDYQVKRHSFGENEHPDILYTIARAVRLEQEATDSQIRLGQRAELQRRELIQQQRQEQDLQQLQLQRGGGALSGSFSSLAQAMQSRFTFGSDSAGEDGKESKQLQKVGLHWPTPIVAKPNTPDNQLVAGRSVATPEIKLNRTVQPFLPHPLVCKRFGIPVPRHALVTTTTTGSVRNPIGASLSVSNSNGDHHVRESDYFENEILPMARQQIPKPREGFHEAIESAIESAHASNPPNDSAPRTGIDRPSLDQLQSIFDPTSEESSLGEDVEDNAVAEHEVGRDLSGEYMAQKPPSQDAKLGDINGHEKLGLLKAASQAMVQFEKGVRGSLSSSSSDTDLSSMEMPSRKRKKEEQRKKKRHRKKTKKKRHSRTHSQSPARDKSEQTKHESEIEESEKSIKEKSWDEQKEGKKKKKSSRKSSSRRDKKRRKT